MEILEDLKAFLNMENIYFNFNPAIKGNCIMLWLYDGIHVSNALRPQVQIKVLNASMPECERIIMDIYNKLSPKDNFQKTIEVNGKKMLITPKQSPFYLEKDENNRHIYVFNIDVIMNRS